MSYFAIKNDNSISRRKEVLPAGWGMKDVQLLIITEAGAIAGVGELGEIYVRRYVTGMYTASLQLDTRRILTHHSPHLAHGYLGLPEATADKFVSNPFSSDAADRMYRTGDLGRYMPDGIGIGWCCTCIVERTVLVTQVHNVPSKW